MVKYETVLRAVVRIVAPSMIGAYEGTRAGIGDIPAKLEKEIDKSAERGEACKRAREVVARYDTSASVKEFIQENPSSIGTDIYKNRETKCAEFLKRYIKWLDMKIAPLTEIPKIVDMPSLPKMPSMPSLPSMPDVGGVKRGLQVSAIVLIGVILLIVYMLTGRGKKGVTVVT